MASAKDNGAIWAIAQNERSSISSLGVVTDSLNRAVSTVDVALSAGQSISDLLNQMKAKALAATDASLDTPSVTALANDYKALRDQIGKIVANADFNGANIIKTGGSNIYALSERGGGPNKLTVAAVNLGLGGGTVTITAAGTFTTANDGDGPTRAGEFLDHRRERRRSETWHVVEPACRPTSASSAS